jgi:hypothetical protein
MLASRRETMDTIGCTLDGAAYCPECCPDTEACEVNHGAIFAYSETQCSAATCDICFAEIDTTVIHDTAFESGHPCTYCDTAELEEH